MSSLIFIATFAGMESKTPVQRPLTWPRLVQLLSRHDEREEKDGGLFSPTLYHKGAKRGIAGVQALTALVLDFDKGACPDDLTTHWEPYEYLIYSTFSHTEKLPKWRAVFPFTAQVPASDWERIYRNLSTVLGQGHTDRSCKDCSRIYYLPSCLPGAPRFSMQHEGAWLDPTAFPDIEPPAEERTTPALTVFTSPITHQNGRVTGETLVQRALERCSSDGRNNAGMWLACQLRDNRFDRDEAARCLEDYQCQVPQGQDVYTLAEALHSLEQAYQSAPREAWEPPARRISLHGRRALSAEDAQTITTTAIEQLPADPGAVFEPEVLEALWTMRKWDPANWARTRKELKAQGVSLKDLDRSLDALKTPADEEMTERSHQRLAGDMLDNCPAPNLTIPMPYVLTETHTGKIVQSEGGSGVTAIAPAPIIIAGRARDILSGQESLLLAYRFPHESWRARIVDRAAALVSRKLAELAGWGFPYFEEKAKDTATYLSRLEAANRANLPLARISRHLGWQGDVDDSPFLLGSSMVLPNGELETTAALDPDHPELWREDRVVYHGASEGEQQLVAAFHSAGTWERWVETVQRLVDYPRVMVPFYASFCAPLLQLWNVPNFIVDVSNSTTTGKSTALRIAASVWGNPDERSPASVVKTWSQTRVGIERLASCISHLPVFLDDTKTAKKADFVAEVVYDVVSGHGRGRGTISGLARTGHWRTILMSTGEQPITSFTQDGGTRTRAICITGMPLGGRTREADHLAKIINRRVVENYGFAGPRWMQWLIQQRDQWPGWRQRYGEWMKHYSSLSSVPEAGRLSQYLALITVAGAMVHEALKLPWEYTNPTQTLAAEITAKAADAAGEERALRDVVSWAYSHEKTFHGRNGELFTAKDSGPVVMSGRWDAEPRWIYIAFFPNVLRQILTDFGYHPDSILAGWREREWLDCLPGGYTNRVRIGAEGQPHMVKIRKTGVDFVHRNGELNAEQGGTESPSCSPVNSYN